MCRCDNSPEDAARIANAGQSEENIKLQNQKFKMFFTGLIFAILSFIGTYPIKTTATYLKVFEIISSFSLLFSGLFLLTELAVFSQVMTNEFYLRKICLYMHGKKLNYWTLFIIGMCLMIVDRSVLLIIN
jgi:hypothetical protein